jgi:hypothetical protein
MDAREAKMAAVKSVSKFWWLWLVVGVLCVVISIVILQFDAASATTVGIIVGVMILFAGLQYIAVEDPIEVLHRDKRAIASQREVQTTLDAAG